MFTPSALCPSSPRASRMLLVAVFCALLYTPQLWASEATVDGLMRWRVMADRESRISFRVPFTYSVPDMHHPGLTRQRGGFTTATVTGEEAANLTPEQIRALLQERARNPSARRINYDVELFYVPLDKLSEYEGKGIHEIATAVANLPEMSWQDFDYYGNVEQRPQATANWAPANITAQIGDHKDRSALVLRYDQGLAVVVCTQGLSAHDNRQILNTVEVMVEQRRELHTYRHGTALRGMIVDHKANIIRAPNSQAVGMKEAWSIETANYHIISNVSPRHLQQYASMMEVLYDAFHKTYMPDRMPLYKMEVAVWATQREMQQAAAATGVGPMSPTALGFFVPSLLNIMTYETGTNRGGFTTFAILAHEASHQFLHVTCNGSRHVPTWINEGLAVYFESSSYERGRLNIEVPRERMNRLRGLYSRMNRMLWPPGDYLKHYGHIPGDNYGEVYLKTHFWIFGVRGGRERFQEYWRALLAGEDGTEAFERIFMNDLIARFGSRGAALDEIEKLILQYARTVR